MLIYQKKKIKESVRTCVCVFLAFVYVSFRRFPARSDFEDSEIRRSLKSKVLFLFNEKSLGFNSPATQIYYILEMSERK